MAPLKRIRHSYLKKRKLKGVKASGSISRDQLKQDFVDLGIQSGETLFVHSAMSKVGYIEGGAETLIEVLQEILGTEGTLAFPTFTFPEGGVYRTISNPDYVFDPEEQPSSVGHITEVFRKMDGVFRSCHPTHSISCWGKNAEKITEEHIETGGNWGPETPFGKLIEQDASILAIGVPISMFTFFHCIEDYYPDLYPNLYHPDKLNVRVKKDGKEEQYAMRYHDPEFLTDRIEKNPSIRQFFHNYFMESGKMKLTKIGKADSLYLSTKDLLQLGHELAQKGKTIYKV